MRLKERKELLQSIRLLTQSVAMIAQRQDAMTQEIANLIDQNQQLIEQLKIEEDAPEVRRYADGTLMET